MNFFHDIPRNLLVYQPPSQFHADAILQRIPEARGINGTFVAVPATLQNSQTLRWMNWPVAPVITDSNYDFPIAPPFRPLAHQKMMANFMVLHPRCFNLSAMGTMKTTATLWAADYLMRQHPPGTCRALIVAPLSILQDVWGKAIFQNFLSRRTFDILYGDAEKRLKILQESKADFIIINFDGVKIGTHFRKRNSAQKKRIELDGLSKALAERTDIKIAIVDEATAYRDAQTDRHEVARLVLGKRDYLWLMSGTPTPNAPTDAYGLSKLVNNAFGKSFTNFREESMFKRGPFRWEARRDGYNKARALLTPSIRYALEDIWDGPPMTTQQREVLLSDEQKKLLAELKRDLQVTVRSGDPITTANEAAARTKFLQVSLGAIYDSNHNVHLIDADARIAELHAVVEEAPGKILIFAPLTSIVEMLYKALGPQRDSKGKLRHAGWSREIVNGNTAQKERSRIFQAFQDEPDPRILVADPGTMAHGLNLYAAQTVVWYGPTDKTELYLQACKRAHRPGQVHPVTVVQLVSNPLEREIYRRLETNTSLQGVLLNMIAKGEI